LIELKRILIKIHRKKKEIIGDNDVKNSKHEDT